MNFLRKPFAFAIIYSVFLILLTGFVLSDTFIIPHAISSVPQTTDNSLNQNTSIDELPQGTEEANVTETIQVSPSIDEKPIAQPSPVVEEGSQISKVETGNIKKDSTPIITDTSYSDENISIKISALTEYSTDIYVADIKLSSPEYLKTALANNTFGTNITEKTSGTAKNNNALFAINGDYYGANQKGYVIKNGTLYRSSMRKDYNYGDLVIYKDGSFEVIYENEITADELVKNGAVNTFAFGPVLVNNSEVTVSKNDEVGKSMASNPRTAIGIIDNCHYIAVVSDGRTSASEGLSLYQLAEIMQDLGCESAYNLDGGGSSTMYFNGKIINNPTTNGKKTSERAVSDIVYIGY